MKSKRQPECCLDATPWSELQPPANVPPGATAISLEELPRFSSWPAALVGARSSPVRQRTPEEVQREYGLEKWGKVFSWLQEHEHDGEPDLWALSGVDRAKVIAFGQGDALFAAPAALVFELYENLLVEVLSRYRRDTVVELGCGLGDKLLRFAERLQARRVIGGEFTASGVECGRILARKQASAAEFVRFDFNQPRTLECVPPDALVYTLHAIEQAPRLSADFFEALCQRRPRWVVHFEQCYEDHRQDSFLGLLRQRYMELNDYNRSWLGLLRQCEQQGRLQILEHCPEIFSVSPFCSLSLLVWSPCDLTLPHQ